MTLEEFRNFKKKILIKSEPALEGKTESENMEKEMRANKHQDHENDFPHETEEIRALLSEEKFNQFKKDVYELCTIVKKVAHPQLSVYMLLWELLCEARKMEPEEIGAAVVKRGILNFWCDLYVSMWAPNQEWQQCIGDDTWWAHTHTTHEVVTDMHAYLRRCFFVWLSKNPKAQVNMKKSETTGDLIRRPDIREVKMLLEDYVDSFLTDPDFHPQDPWYEFEAFYRSQLMISTRIEDIGYLLSQKNFYFFRETLSDLCHLIEEKFPNFSGDEMLLNLLAVTKEMKPQDVQMELLTKGILQFLADRLELILEFESLWKKGIGEGRGFPIWPKAA